MECILDLNAIGYEFTVIMLGFYFLLFAKLFRKFFLAFGVGNSERVVGKKETTKQEPIS